MKKILLLLLVMALNACNNNDDTSTNPIDQLPPATQTGANTIGCLVNGEALLPKGSPLAGPVKSAFYQLIDGEYFFGLSFSNKKGQSMKGLSIGVLRMELSENQIIILDKNALNDGDFKGGGEYSSSVDVFTGSDYFTNSIQQGEIIITHLDESEQNISGTFWFDAVNHLDGEDIVEIREGRFDMPYSK
ncbi:hypothetical protein SAMN05421824_0200 [Hyunsoonleella jejuensis]|uniref:Lipoprotein n=1 Tax=Hyunsoonleella jejuensis TaxID=419940 RepID=A0A1H9ABW8_9FLAO|nr:DUF6252 family protein [Hyunsoonleella jejuensis]SEP74160.1 hypothetical protein SAMN05421824_0200 [Hyunsoonleella jejuensis]